MSRENSIYDVMRNSVSSLFLLLSLMLTPICTHAMNTLELDLLDEDFTIERYPADGDDLLIFISAGLGLQERVDLIAKGVADLGIEFWHINIAENLFLPKISSSFRNLDGRFVASLVQKANLLTGKKITLLSHAFAAIPTLRGIRKWQHSRNENKDASTIDGDLDGRYFTGAILLSPDLFLTVPDLGLEPDFSPISSATNIPVYILQSGNRSNRWQLEKVINELQKGGATVFSKVFPGVIGIFYGEDTSEATRSLVKSLPLEISNAIGLLAKISISSSLPPIEKPGISGMTSLDMSLKEFKGNEIPPSLDLVSVRGERSIHAGYKGKVTLVNFWATWCGACVEEIPSLNRLRKIMSDTRFELISVDYAEDKATVLKFLQEVDVDFPVLLDSDGKVSALWNVLVFPSTFVIGVDGKIVYGIRGGLHWDDPLVVKKLKFLLDQG